MQDIPTPDPTLAADAHPPARIARLVEEVGLRKARLSLVQLCMLGALAGIYIAFGAMLFTLVMTGADPASGLARWIGGIAFSVGLVLVIVAGAELFTGNSLILMAWAGGRISLAALGRNWSIVYLANLAGSVAAAVAIWLAETYDLHSGEVGRMAAAIAEAKAALPFGVALVRGILCNVLVCLAVWLCYASHSVTDRILSIMLPVSAFVALGFEHSVANMFLMPVGWLHGAEIGAWDMAANLVPVTIGNVIGGGVFVAGVYWAVYLRQAPG